MKIRLLLLLLLIPAIVPAQELIKCNEKIYFLISQKEDFSCYIKLEGNVRKTENIRIITFNNCLLQTLLVKKQKFITTENEDISILINYIMSETHYYTGIYKDSLNVEMIPINISKNKKAIIWHFDTPEKYRSKFVTPHSPIVKQISISIVYEDFIYSIGTNQFKDQSFEDLKKLLSDLILSAKYRKGLFDTKQLCNGVK